MAYTGFWHRFAAWQVDGILYGVVMAVIILVGMPVYSFSTLAGWGILFVGVLLLLLLGVYVPVRKGATFGKRLLRLRLVTKDGKPVSYRVASLRFIGQFGIPLFIQVAGFVMLGGGKEQILEEKEMPAPGTMMLMLYIMALYGWYIVSALLVRFGATKRSLSDYIAGTCVEATSEHEGEVAGIPQMMGVCFIETFVGYLMLLPMGVIYFIELLDTVFLMGLSIANVLLIVIACVLNDIWAVRKYGATFAMLLMRTTIVSMDGKPLTGGMIFRRMVGHVPLTLVVTVLTPIIAGVLVGLDEIDVLELILMFALVWHTLEMLLILLDRNRRSVADRIARTKVIYK